MKWKPIWKSSWNTVILKPFLNWNLLKGPRLSSWLLKPTRLLLPVCIACIYVCVFSFKTQIFRSPLFSVICCELLKIDVNSVFLFLSLHHHMMIWRDFFFSLFWSSSSDSWNWSESWFRYDFLLVYIFFCCCSKIKFFVTCSEFL